jgi:hypothetical protein
MVVTGIIAEAPVELNLVDEDLAVLQDGTNTFKDKHNVLDVDLRVEEAGEGLPLVHVLLRLGAGEESLQFLLNIRLADPSESQNY